MDQGKDFFIIKIKMFVFHFISKTHVYVGTGSVQKGLAFLFAERFQDVPQNIDLHKVNIKGTCLYLQGVPTIWTFLENVDFSLIFRVCQWNFHTFTAFGYFYGYMNLSLSFVMYAELLPLILKKRFSHFSRFSTFLDLLLGVRSSMTAIMLL